jgi:hypothetical protein
MAFDPDFNHAVGFRARHAQQDIAFFGLAFVKRCTVGLAHLAFKKPGGAGNAATIPASYWQDVTQRLDGVDNRYVFTNVKCQTIPVF